MPKYSVQFNPRLQRQLDVHAAFIARVSKPAARRLLEEFRELVKQLRANPYLYPPCDDPNLPPNLYHKANIAKWYKVIYYIEGEQVFVEAAVDCRSRG